MARDLVEQMQTAASSVLDGEPVIVAYLFGSQATGQARPDSDVDVAVLLDADFDTESFLAVRLRVAGALERAAGIGPVEVVVLNDAPLRLQGRVLQTGAVVYCRDEALRVRYESLTRRRHLDFEPKAMELDRELLQAHAEGRR